MADLLIVFLKWPEPGSVKTRLAKAVGNEEAVRIYRELVQRVLQKLAGLAGKVEICCCFAPPQREMDVRQWIGAESAAAGLDPEAVYYWPQADGDLGVRLRSACQRGFDEHFGRIAVIGTDCVDLSSDLVSQAFSGLDGERVVFGPAKDGGYYLAAIDGPEQLVMFDDIPWSAENTLDVSIARLRKAGFKVELLEELSDVDTIEDWQRLLGLRRCE